MFGFKQEGGIIQIINSPRFICCLMVIFKLHVVFRLPQSKHVSGITLQHLAKQEQDVASLMPVISLSVFFY